MKFPAVIKAEADRLFLNVFPFSNVCQGMVESLQDHAFAGIASVVAPAVAAPAEEKKNDNPDPVFAPHTHATAVAVRGRTGIVIMGAPSERDILSPLS